MFLRIIGVIVLLAIIIVGYFLIRDAIIAKKLDTYSQYAGVIAETSIAATVYRNNSDSFLVARDSILNRYNLTLEDVNAFKKKMKKKPDDWRIVFDMAAYMADSLIDIRTRRAKIPSDGSKDSSSIKK